VPNPCFYFLQIIENQTVMVFRNFTNQENKKLGLSFYWSKNRGHLKKTGKRTEHRTTNRDNRNTK